MYVQVIKGRTNDAAGLRSQLDKWRAELKPGAIGFLGSTGGIADDGTVFLIARFSDDVSAKDNADRPEQDAWWKETAPYFDGAPTFRESSDITTMFEGGSNQAGFVQVMEGTVTDREKADAFESPEMLAELKAARPDLIGSVRAWFDGGAFVDVAYFTSEEAARQGEQSEEFNAKMQEYGALFGEMTFIDLRQPLLD